MSLWDSKQVLQRTAGMNRGGARRSPRQSVMKGSSGLQRQIRTFFFLLFIRLSPPSVKSRTDICPEQSLGAAVVISSSVLQRQSSLEVIHRKELRRQPDHRLLRWENGMTFTGSHPHGVPACKTGARRKGGQVCAIFRRSLMSL